MNLFATTLLRGAWRLAKVTAATAISTAGAHMLIINVYRARHQLRQQNTIQNTVRDDSKLLRSAHNNS